jgi:hypothetical protein
MSRIEKSIACAKNELESDVRINVVPGILVLETDSANTPSHPFRCAQDPNLSTEHKALCDEGGMTSHQVAPTSPNRGFASVKCPIPTRADATVRSANRIIHDKVTVPRRDLLHFKHGERRKLGGVIRGSICTGHRKQV